MTRFDSLDPAEYALPQELTERLLSPALVVHLDKVRENVRRVLGHMDGDVDRWRPHVKTSKIPAVFAELARAGLRRFKCATTREADQLARVLDAEEVEGGDVLLAYPLIGPALVRLGQVAETHPAVRFSVLCEEAGAVASVPAAVSVFVDLNPGMNRTGVPLDEEARIHRIAAAAGERLRGLHFYDGHLHEGTPAERRALAHAGYDRLMGLVARVAAGGAAVEEIVTSGSPTFPHALAYEPFAQLERTAHRVSPGTVVYDDLNFERQCPEVDLLPAAVVFARVVSHPAADLATCDAGSKAFAAEAGAPYVQVVGHPEYEPQPPNEEHLPLRVPPDARPPRGTHLYLIPKHVCPTINLAEEAVLVDSGGVVGVVPVAARAHETLLE